MHLTEQQALVRQRWEELLAELRSAGVNDQVLLGTLAAECSRLVARQMPAASDSWLEAVRSHVALLRERQSPGVVPEGELSRSHGR